jgi:dipeptidyl aminopeptidase/acylaminoacyl peptidase
VTSFTDLAAFTALPRLTTRVLSPDGARLVAVLQEPDADGARYTSSLWQIPLAGADGPARLTRSEKGETSPAFLPDGSLLFLSSRPDPAGESDSAADGAAALWLLPPLGEARVLARSPGGLGTPVVAADAGTVIVSGSLLAAPLPGDAASADEAERRKIHKQRKINAILHTGMPIRHWDRELGDVSPRLLGCDPVTGQLRDLTPDAGQALHETSYSISADGRAVVATWRARRRGGRFDYTVVAIDPHSGARRAIADEPGIHHTGARVSPDGRRVALLREDQGGFDRPGQDELQIRVIAGGATACTVDLGDVHPSEWVWSHDSATLFVSGDLHGRGAVLAIDGASGAATHLLATDASYSNLCPSPDGRHLYALRSAIDSAPTPVRLGTAAEKQTPAPLPTPAPTPDLPGTLTELHTTAPGGAGMHGWLCLPPAGEGGGVGPAPLMVWIHGGPFSSWNAWSWRWNPWVAVARGYAVLLPDPALSTGYGPEWIERAWPHRAGLVWQDVEAMLEDVLARPDVDAGRTACLGASFGGYMTNWIAGHTDRFRAIVTHAGLYALDQQHPTTDAAAHKVRVHRTPEELPDWYRKYSPHHHIKRFSTPMLVTHGVRDYRVPISEALRLWWDLVSHWRGRPQDLPHRLLQFTSENHWILSPNNSRVWANTVLGFCDQHVLGADPLPDTVYDW